MCASADPTPQGPLRRSPSARTEIMVLWVKKKRCRSASMTTRRRGGGGVGGGGESSASGWDRRLSQQEEMPLGKKERPERGSIFSNFSAHADGSDRAGWHRKGPGRERGFRPRSGRRRSLDVRRRQAPRCHIKTKKGALVRSIELARRAPPSVGRSRRVVGPSAFFFQISRSMPTANAEDPRRSEGT